MKRFGREEKVWDGIITSSNLERDARGRRVHDGHENPELRNEGKSWEEQWQYNKSSTVVMPTHDVSGIIKLTSELLDIPEKTVKLCVDTTFQELKGWLRKPYGAAAVMINDFGTFALNLRVINARLYNLIPFLRGKRREKYIKRFQELWAYRQLAIDYENRRTSTKRHLTFEFKKQQKKKDKKKEDNKEKN